MADKKYAKHLTQNTIGINRHGNMTMSTRHLEQFFGGDFSIDCGFIQKPLLMIPKPHKHDFDQYLCFFGSAVDDISNFDAEIEYSLGEEMEKYLITTPTIVYVPAGLSHGPLNFAKINKPVLFVDIAQSHKYYRTWEAEDPK